MAETAGKIVVGVDGSDHSHRALDWAIEEARLRRLGIVLVHTYDYKFAGVTAYPGNAPEILEEDARRLLEADVARTRSAGVSVEGVLEYGSPSEALIDASLDAAMLVVGCRGRGSLAGALLGSVSSACVHHAHCPVIVIRPSRPAESTESDPVTDRIAADSPA